ncbi:MAG: DUF2062 domain-containing protein [Luteolibacter sp.]
MKQRYLRLVRKTFRTLRHRRLRHRSWWQSLTRPLFARNLWVPCRDSVAIGLSIGLFFSMIPAIPQSICAAILAMRFKGNVPFAIAACFISNIFTNGPIWLIQAKLGVWLHEIGVPIPQMFLKANMKIPGVGVVDVGSFTLGCIATGVILALAAFPIVHLFSALQPHHLPVKKKKGPPLTPLGQNAEP